MLRAILAAVIGLGLAAGVGAADKAAKNQMVKGTIKSADASKSVLVVNQKVKNETVDRELSITPTTEFSITKDGKTTESTGKDGLVELEKLSGAQVTVKCDKDVNVLKVTVKAK